MPGMWSKHTARLSLGPHPAPSLHMLIIVCNQEEQFCVTARQHTHGDKGLDRLVSCTQARCAKHALHTQTHTHTHTKQQSSLCSVPDLHPLLS